MLTINIMFLSPLTGGVENAKRAELLARADYFRGYDVVTLQEGFNNAPTNTVKAGLAAEYPHQTPTLGRSSSGWDDTRNEGLFWSLTPENGGVSVLSKWPIVEKIQYIYSEGCGWDWFANKGFVFVTLDVRGAAVHVVATHAQAEDSMCDDAAAVRATQFAEMDDFLDDQDIPADEPVIVAGDLNVNRSTPEYAAMLAATDTVPPTSYDGAANSFDPGSNSLAGHRYAGYPAEHLDYVLLRRGHQMPGQWTNTVLTPKSPPWTSGDTTFDDYSDHYPVAGG